MGRFDEAERMLRRALDLRRSQRDDRSTDVATSLNNLADVVRQRGRHDEAVQLTRDALAIQQRVLGPRHTEVGLTLARLAGLTSDRAAAESLYRAAREIQRAAFGPENLAVIPINVYLAGILEQRGAFEGAEALLRENLAIRSRLLGPEHPLTATSLTHLANLLSSYGHQSAEAEVLYNRALTILRNQPPRWQPYLLGVLSGLIGVSIAHNDFVRAESLSRELLDVQRRAWGAEHPYVSEGMGLVAEQLANQRRYSEAEAMARQSLALLERTLGPQHSRVGRALVLLAHIHLSMGRRSEAEADLRRALEVTERSRGPMDKWVGAIAALLGDVIARGGATAESKALFDRAASILRPLTPQLEPDMRAAYTALADHYKALNQLGEEEYFRRLGSGR
jgi:tetratricopeptide (TPR) repeat protein